MLHERMRLAHSGDCGKPPRSLSGIEKREGGFGSTVNEEWGETKPAERKRHDYPEALPKAEEQTEHPAAALSPAEEALKGACGGAMPFPCSSFSQYELNVHQHALPQLCYLFIVHFPSFRISALGV